MIDLARLVEQAVVAACDRGAGDAEAYAGAEMRREVRVHGGKVESLSAATQRGLGLRAWIDGRVGYAYGTDLSALGVRGIAARATEAARVADRDEFAVPPNADGPKTGHQASEIGPSAEIVGLSDPDIAAWSTDRVAELALEVERAALDHDRVRGVEQAVYVDSAERVAIATSSGAGGDYEASSCYAYAQALAGDDAGRESGLGFGIGRGPGRLDPIAIGREAAERATAMIGSAKPDSRACAVVLDATVAASFVGLLGKALGADAVQRGRSPLASLIGERVAADAFVLHDDGLVPDGFGSSPVDAEGVPRRRTPLIEGGTLRTFLHDTYTARRGETVSTGNAGRSGYRAPPGVAASNLIVRPGAMSFDELLGEAGDGVFVTDVAGLHAGVNPVTGVFSVGASGRVIRGGESAEAVREFTIAGDLVSMLRSVRAVGAEPRWVPFGGSVSTPPLLIGELTVAGS